MIGCRVGVDVDRRPQRLEPGLELLLEAAAVGAERRDAGEVDRRSAVRVVRRPRGRSGSADSSPGSRRPAGSGVFSMMPSSPRPSHFSMSGMPTRPMSVDTTPRCRSSAGGKSCAPSPSGSPRREHADQPRELLAQRLLLLAHRARVVDHEQQVDLVDRCVHILTAELRRWIRQRRGRVAGTWSRSAGRRARRTPARVGGGAGREQRRPRAAGGEQQPGREQRRSRGAARSIERSAHYSSLQRRGTSRARQSTPSTHVYSTPLRARRRSSRGARAAAGSCVRALAARSEWRRCEAPSTAPMLALETAGAYLSRHIRVQHHGASCNPSDARVWADAQVAAARDDPSARLT